jgi:hypothetical protein
MEQPIGHDASTRIFHAQGVKSYFGKDKIFRKAKKKNQDGGKETN